MFGHLKRKIVQKSPVIGYHQRRRLEIGHGYDGLAIGFLAFWLLYLGSYMIH
jgi:hypothetical protein